MLNNNHIIKTLSNTILSSALVLLITSAINIVATKEEGRIELDSPKQEINSPRGQMSVVPNFPKPPYN